MCSRKKERYARFAGDDRESSKPPPVLVTGDLQSAQTPAPVAADDDSSSDVEQELPDQPEGTASRGCRAGIDHLDAGTTGCPHEGGGAAEAADFAQGQRVHDQGQQEEPAALDPEPAAADPGHAYPGDGRASVPDGASGGSRRRAIGVTTALCVLVGLAIGAAVHFRESAAVYALATAACSLAAFLLVFVVIHASIKPRWYQRIPPARQPASVNSAALFWASWWAMTAFFGTLSATGIIYMLGARLGPAVPEPVVFGAVAVEKAIAPPTAVRHLHRMRERMAVRDHFAAAMRYDAELLKLQANSAFADHPRVSRWISAAGEESVAMHVAIPGQRLRGPHGEELVLFSRGLTLPSELTVEQKAMASLSEWEALQSNRYWRRIKASRDWEPTRLAATLELQGARQQADSLLAHALSRDKKTQMFLTKERFDRIVGPVAAGDRQILLDQLAAFETGGMLLIDSRPFIGDYRSAKARRAGQGGVALDGLKIYRSLQVISPEVVRKELPWSQRFYRQRVRRVLEGLMRIESSPHAVAAAAASGTFPASLSSPSLPGSVTEASELLTVSDIMPTYLTILDQDQVKALELLTGLSASDLAPSLKSRF